MSDPLLEAGESSGAWNGRASAFWGSYVGALITRIGFWGPLYYYHYYNYYYTVGLWGSGFLLGALGFFGALGVRASGF